MIRLILAPWRLGVLALKTGGLARSLELAPDRWPWSAVAIMLVVVRRVAGLLILACCRDSQVATPIATPLDEVLAPGQVRAGRITKASELIPGEAARGAVGDYKIYNDRIAVIIADARATPSFHPYGGIILDAAPAGGTSAFGEIVSALDLVVQKPERIEVVADGSDGREARIRTVGSVDVLPLFVAVVGDLFPNRDYDLEWQIDYVLAPNSDVLAIEHTVQNRAVTDAALIPIAGLFFGGSAQPFVDGAGFAFSKSGFSYDYYAAVGPTMTYVFGAPGLRINALFGESGLVVGTIGEDPVELRAREKKTIVHQLVIGGGDLSSSWASWRKLLDPVPSGTIAGTVANATSGRIHVLAIDPSDPERDYVTQTLIRSDGTFSLELPEGRYSLMAATDERLVSSPIEVEVRAGMETTAALTIPSTGTVEFAVLDEAQRALPVKISVEGEGAPSLPSKFGERAHGRDLVRTEFAEHGTGRLELAPGSYTVYFSRGGEYEISTHAVTIAAGETIDLEATLARSVSTPGWMSSDPHLHALLSPDSADTDLFKIRALAADNVELPISTEHEVVGDYQPAVRELGLEDWIHAIVGTEITTIRYGHFNAFPLTQDKTKPGNGRIDWFGRTPSETLAMVRALPNDPFLQVNHPRSTTIGYFSRQGLDTATLVATSPEFSMNFDGFEVSNSCGDGSLDADTVLDWFSFLNHGLRIVATGSSDDHTAGRGQLGMPISYLAMPTDDPRAATPEDLRRAYKEGRVTVSCGPFVELEHIGEIVPADGSIALDARVAAPSWMDVDTLRVIWNGEVVQTIPTSTTGAGDRFDGTIDVAVPANTDGWIILWASGDQRHGIWAQKRPSYAFTNPVFIDGDRDGAWRP
jgi:hypothetical protein